MNKKTNTGLITTNFYIIAPILRFEMITSLFTTI